MQESFRSFNKRINAGLPLISDEEKEFESEEKDKLQGRLIASNGEVLFITSTYSSKAALLAGYDKVKARIDDGNITVARDKQNRYQFRVYSDNGMLLLMGETYPSKDGAVKAAASARNFWTDETVAVNENILRATLRPHSCLMAEFK